MTRVRVRQHVNPLSREYSRPVVPPDWSHAFDCLQRPLHVDIGCARGRLLQQLAVLEPEWNFLGVEIREPLVRAANAWRDREKLTNLHFLFCNINVSLDVLLNSLPVDRVRRVSFLFPDPWFKKRHQKRRVVQPTVVELLGRSLLPKSEILLASDVEAVAVEMRDRFAESPFFRDRGAGRWLADNPLPIASEREIACRENNRPVYRTIFERLDENKGKISCKAKSN